MLRLRRQSNPSPGTPSRAQTIATKSAKNTAIKMDETLEDNLEDSMNEKRPAPLQPRNMACMKVRYFMQDQRVEIELEGLSSTRV